MIRIVINEEKNTASDMANLLREIADQIDKGNTSGYYPTWTMTDETERERKINFIKETLSTYGQTNTAELELESSPVFQNHTGKICQLVEEFTQDYARVVMYDDEIVIHEDDVPYEELSDELIDEIYEIIEQYKVAQEKLFDSCRDEDRD